MKEKDPESNRLSDAVLAKEPQSDKDLNRFLGFLRESVTLESLLEDRLSQAFIHVILREHRHRDAKGTVAIPEDKNGNPYPTIEYRYANNQGGGFKRGTFMLEGDDNHLYYIDPLWPEKTPFLRPQDIIPAKNFDESNTLHHGGRTGLSFHQPLERISLDGGITELYNYNTQQWECVRKEQGLEKTVRLMDRQAIMEVARTVVEA